MQTSSLCEICEMVKLRNSLSNKSVPVTEEESREGNSHNAGKRGQLLQLKIISSD